MDRVDVSPLYIKSAYGDPELEAIACTLIPEFKLWWQTKSHPDFGRDAPYHDPQASRDSALMHVHLLPICPPATVIDLQNWGRARRDYDRRSDRHLIYAKSSCGWAYLLAYEHTDAHEVARDYDYLRALAAAAEAWYSQTNRFPYEPNYR